MSLRPTFTDLVEIRKNRSVAVWCDYCGEHILVDEDFVYLGSAIKTKILCYHQTCAVIACTKVLSAITLPAHEIADAIRKT